MSAATEIENYTKQLSRMLSSLPEADRAGIVAEIRAHLEHRADENRLDEAIAALGAPTQCARGFLEEFKLQEAFTDGGPAKTFGTLLSLASQRTAAASGLFISGVFFLLAAGFTLTALAEIVAPGIAGLWIHEPTGVFAFGVIDPGSVPADAEVLGGWMFPVAVALAVISIIAGQRFGRFFVRLMMKK